MTPDQIRAMGEQTVPERPLTWTAEAIKRFWQWQVRHPDHYFTKRFGGNIAYRLAPWLRNAGNVLDFGCGPGFLVPHLAALGLKVHASDHSQAAIDSANRRFADVPGFSGARTFQAIVESGERFEAIVSIEVIEHLDDAQVAEFVNSIVSLLMPGGTAVITTPNDENLRASDTYCPQCDQVFHRYQHMRTWTDESLSALFECAGLDIVRTFTTDFAIRLWRHPVLMVKKVAKQILRRPDKNPHLVCVMKKPL
jgi:2-polyprenyl-3-methyl-5-hydroxy-6-metoxy-1,4-benzoquinol methylase